MQITRWLSGEKRPVSFRLFKSAIFWSRMSSEPKLVGTWARSWRMSLYLAITRDRSAFWGMVRAMLLISASSERR